MWNNEYIQRGKYQKTLDKVSNLEYVQYQDNEKGSYFPKYNNHKYNSKNKK